MKQDRIKILYVIGTLDLGGAERQLVALAKGLDRSKFFPIVYCLTATGPLLPELTRAGIQVKCFGLRGLTIRRNPILVARRLVDFLLSLKKERPDVVHGLLFHAYILGSFAARLARVPIVIASRRSLGLFKERKLHYRLIEKVANRMTDLIIANSVAVREDVLRQEKVLPSKVRVIYNGIDPFLYEIQTDVGLRASLGLPNGAKVIGVVGNLIHYKGHRFFLQACPEVKAKFPDVRFLLIGDGPLRGELEVMAGELGIKEEVIFLGSRNDIPALLSIIDLFVLPSLEEGFSNAILEAMAAGKPVVATRVGGIPEAVVHEETGLLVPPKDPKALADAIIRVLSDPELAMRMGKAGRDRVIREFSLDRMVRSLEQVYEELVQAKLGN